jgi:ferritin
MPERDISREITGSTYTANGLHHQHELLKELLHLHAYVTTVVHKLRNTQPDATMNFVNWYLHEVHESETYRPHSLCLATLSYILGET